MKATFEYKGIYFYEGTPLNLCDKLIELMNSRERVIIDYSYTKEVGRIGKTTGIKPMLILVYNSRSCGGSIISSDKVFSIKSSLGKRLLYII